MTTFTDKPGNGRAQQHGYPPSAQRGRGENEVISANIRSTEGAPSIGPPGDSTSCGAGFFRDAAAWEALRLEAIRPLAVRHTGPVRAWIMGCDGGQAAYSLAILIAEESTHANKRFPVRIFATEPASDSLARARAGIYGSAIASELSAERLGRFFESDGGRYHVKKSLRDQVIFARHDLLRDPPFSNLDILVCCRLPHHAGSRIQHRIGARLMFSLRSGGYLMLPNAGTGLGDISAGFEMVSETHRIWRRVGRADPGLMAEMAKGHTPGDKTASLSTPAPETLDGASRQKYQSALLEASCPPSAIVDVNGRIEYLYGDVAPYLSFDAQGADQSLFERLDEPLRPAVRRALKRAIERGGPATARARLNGGRPVTISAARMPQLTPARYRVSFIERAASSGIPSLASGSRGTDPSSFAAADSGLAAENQSLRRELHATVQDYESATGELRESNDVLTAANEELQSAGEELEASRQEAQAANEELAATIARLNQKIHELETLTADLDNLLASTEIAVIFLDPQLRVRRFTPAAGDLFALVPGDIGRPLGDVAQRFSGEEIIPELLAVAASRTPLESELQSHSGRWYLHRTLPYYAADSRLGGLVMTFVEVSEIKAASAQLHEALEAAQQSHVEAESASRAKDEFISMVSHELRTPLNTIRMWSRMLATGRLGVDKAIQGGHAIDRAAVAQQQLVDDLLDVSRIAVGRLRIEPRDAPLAEVVQRAVEAARARAESRRIGIEVELCPDAGIAYIDPGRMQQVVGNLLTNAVKFTPEGGRITVRLRRQNSVAEILVQDTGIGIRPDLLPHVFDRFRQGDSAATRRHGGLGLGLAIAKQLTELHGGEIVAQSAGEGRGAAFLVRLPLERRFEAGADAQEAASSAHSADFDRLEVLLVEDDPESRDATRHFLEEHGARVEVADSAAQARRCFEQHSPGLLLLDIGMPGEDGYCLLRSLRRIERDQNRMRVPAIAVTAFARDEDRARAAAAGFDRHIPKPIDPDELIRAAMQLGGSGDRMT